MCPVQVLGHYSRLLAHLRPVSKGGGMAHRLWERRLEKGTVVGVKPVLGVKFLEEIQSVVALRARVFRVVAKGW